MTILRVIFGLLLLFAGRKLYWLFVAVVGFVAGFTLAEQIFPQSSMLVQIVIGLIGGLIGAALAIFLNRLAVGLAGFLGGGLLAMRILVMIGIGNGDFNWIPFIIGGIIGAVLVALIFDWALIVLSSLGGAVLIGSVWNTTATWLNLVILVLFLIGIIVQASGLRQEADKS
jgi:hypothetical protein